MENTDYQWRSTTLEIHKVNLTFSYCFVSLDEQRIFTSHFASISQSKPLAPILEYSKLNNYDCIVNDVWKESIPNSIKIKNNETVHNKYKILEKIGTGAFGVVHRCVELSTNAVWAAKIVNTPSDVEKATVRKEINTMSIIRHPALINLHDAYESDTNMVMIYEFMSGGELFEKVSDVKNQITENEASNYIRQVCNALKYMHKMNYVHLDLKPENIMFTTKHGDQLKLIDFGLTEQIDPQKPVKVTVGTAEFAAPEIVDGCDVSYYTDMWSVGVLSYILLSGLSPFGGENDEETLQHIRKCNWSMADPAFNLISNNAKNFIQSLLIMDPAKRMTVNDALEHPWLAESSARETIPQIPCKRIAVRDAIRNKFDAFPKPNPFLGRVSNYISLKNYKSKQNNIKKSSFDCATLPPKFFVRPYNSTCSIGQSFKFFCKIWAPMLTQLTVKWFKDDVEIAVKDKSRYFQRLVGNDCSLMINSVTENDKGKYMIRAENIYGKSEEVAILNVSKSISTQSILKKTESTFFLSSWTNDMLLLSPKLVKTSSFSSPIRCSPFPLSNSFKFMEKNTPPVFTFYLRPRFIQQGHSCKLLCTVTGNPVPTIEWLKNGIVLTNSQAKIQFISSICSLEILNTQMEDAGHYVCRATNDRGNDFTECFVYVKMRNW